MNLGIKPKPLNIYNVNKVSSVYIFEGLTVFVVLEDDHPGNLKEIFLQILQINT